MIMKKVIKQLAVLFVLAVVSTAANGQTFPNYFPLNQYDMQRGGNSFLRWVNYDASKPNEYNDAIIFATSTSTSNNAPKDLLRLTIAGVATFNSPFSGFSQAIELRNQGVLDGRFRISGTMLDIEGSSAINLGTINNPFLFQVAENTSTSRTALKFVDSSNNNLWLGLERNRTNAWVGTRSSTNLTFGVNSTSAMTIETGSHNIYVGLTDTEISTVSQSAKSKYGFFVKKGVLSEDYAIAPVSSWADFVFSSDYKLRPISEVENFISENSHLPDVPSAENVSTEGYSQHDMNKVLLQKIEELTLYIIQQDKEIQLLKSEMKK